MNLTKTLNWQLHLLFLGRDQANLRQHKGPRREEVIGKLMATGTLVGGWGSKTRWNWGGILIQTPCIQISTQFALNTSPNLCGMILICTHKKGRSSYRDRDRERETETETEKRTFSTMETIVIRESKVYGRKTRECVASTHLEKSIKKQSPTVCNQCRKTKP